MTPGVVIDIEGTISSFTASEREVRLFTRFSVMEATHKGKDIAFALAPVETGYYRSTFRTEFTSSGSMFYGEFGTDDEKGYWLEVGTHSGPTLEWHEGKPHFSPAAMQAEAILVAGIERALSNV